MWLCHATSLMWKTDYITTALISLPIMWPGHHYRLHWLICEQSANRFFFHGGETFGTQVILLQIAVLIGLLSNIWALLLGSVFTGATYSLLLLGNSLKSLFLIVFFFLPHFSHGPESQESQRRKCRMWNRAFFLITLHHFITWQYLYISLQSEVYRLWLG